MTVYFIRMTGTDYYKVGYTYGAADQRLSGNQTGNPILLSLEFAIPGKSRSHEKYIQDALAPYWVRGEWYRLDRSIIDYIYEVFVNSDVLNYWIKEGEFKQLPKPDNVHPETQERLLAALGRMVDWQPS